QPKKKSMLPIILGVVALGAVVAVLVLVVLKTKYDITGEWLLIRTRTDIAGSPSTRYLTFTGDKKTGSVRIDFDTWGSSDPDTGTYTVDDKAVSFLQTWTTYQYQYDGNFTDKNTMSGTFRLNYPSTSESGTWTATRRVTATAPHQVAAQNSQDLDSKSRQQR
ncbi:MAG TPA: hypothetical protein VLQ89_03395, partial [Candidatus Binatia bacterium]|nr:hypothetical protein [Candidatus Binatia bacterium]